MSVIVALKDNDRIIVGCDDRESSNVYFDDYSRNQKAFVCQGRNNYIIGCAGNITIGEMLSRKISKLDVINKETLLETILDFHKSYYDSIFFNSRIMSCELIIAIADKAYSISSNLIVSEITDFDAIGSGIEVAIGSLYTSKYLNCKPELRVYLAVESAGKSLATVSTNVYMSDTKTLLFQKMKSK